MSISINFVNKGTDLEVLNKSYESLPIEQQEELAKALKKDGLVLVQVQVNGKHGAYTKGVWKRASDVKKQSNTKIDNKPTKIDTTSASKKDTNQSKPEPKSLAKGKPTAESKNAVKAAAKKHGNDKVMEAAKKVGIKWKESSHEGINWMRCAMALSVSNKLQEVNDSLDGNMFTTKASDSKSNYNTPKDNNGKFVKMPKNPTANDLLRYTRGDSQGKYSKKLSDSLGLDPEQSGVFVKEDKNGNKTFFIDDGQIAGPNEIDGKQLEAMIEKYQSDLQKRGKTQKFTKKLSKRLVNKLTESTKKVVDNLPKVFNSLPILVFDKNSDFVKNAIAKEKKNNKISYPNDDEVTQTKKAEEYVKSHIDAHNKAVKTLQTLAKKMSNHSEPKITSDRYGTHIAVTFDDITVGEIKQMLDQKYITDPFFYLDLDHRNGIKSGVDPFGVDTIKSQGTGVKSDFNFSKFGEDNDPVTFEVEAENYTHSEMGGVDAHDLTWNPTTQEWEK